MALPVFSMAMAATTMQLSIVLSPVIAYGVISRSKNILTASLLTIGISFVIAAILFMPNFGWLANLHYNWLQKLLAFLCIILLPRLLSYDKSVCGFGAPKASTAFATGLLIGLLFAFLDSLMTVEHSVPKLETVLFELSMPGLQEEPLYRGLLLCIWDKYLGRPWKAFGVEFGGGCVITTSLFTVSHLITLDRSWHPIVNLDPLQWFNFAIFCMTMCWLRYKFDSAWVSVIAHNADNGICFLLSGLIAHFREGA